MYIYVGKVIYGTEIGFDNHQFIGIVALKGELHRVPIGLCPATQNEVSDKQCSDRNRQVCSAFLQADNTSIIIKKEHSQILYLR